MFNGWYDKVVKECNKRNIFKIVPEFGEIHEQFIFLQTASEKPFYLCTETFSKKWDIYVTNEQFKVYWNIDILKKLVQEYKCEPATVPIRFLDDKYDKWDNTKVDHYIQQETIEPIIIAYFFGRHIVIDGNHRLQSRIKKGEKGIKSYCVIPEIYSKAFLNEKSLATYICYHNLSVLSAVCKHNIAGPLFINQSFKPNSFYSNKYSTKLSSWVKLRLLIGL